MNETKDQYLPVNDSQRVLLHDEIHTRPSATIALPALIVYVAVLNSKVSVQEEFDHLKSLPLDQTLELDMLRGNFLQLQMRGYKLIWERHSEFTRYTLVQSLPEHALWGTSLPQLGDRAATGSEWLRRVPGTTITAIHLGLMNEGMDDPDVFFKAKKWLGHGTLIGSKNGEDVGQSTALLYDDQFENRR